ncbi:MAG: hypothetical protein P0Y56_02605 [Candidatus Andeanibacterium colombiense]|uniref:Uncharacterized protein n=1 Tax=Candidatus Andeanibacterium colombiense TaxID=3121345 RepID=A0AAJ5X3P8_9SPHN|nr:MAG: hypothetical protein P0Y56_02605 [Sphingomonadaceae bacterium]
MIFLLTRYVRPDHGGVIAARSVGQLTAYVVGGAAGALLSSPTVTFAICTVALLALEIGLAKKHGFLARQGSLKTDLLKTAWLRIFAGVFAGVTALAFLPMSFGLTGPISVLPALVASTLAYAAIGVNLPGSLVTKAREQ